MIKKIKKFAKFFVMISCLSLLSYVFVQQDYRQSANDPQIQKAEDFADGLASGQMKPYLPDTPIDISKSLGLFEMVLDNNGEIVVSSANLAGNPPVPPKGVLDYAREHGENRVTWEPQKGVREAIVVKYYSGTADSGFVVVGRSLKEVEIREDKLTKMFFTGWVGTIVATFAVGLIL